MNQEEEGPLGSSNRVLKGSILLDKDIELCQQLNLVQLQYQQLVEEGCIPAKSNKKHIKLKIFFQAESKVLTTSRPHPSTYMLQY